MGKKEGGGSLFAAYMAAMPEPANQEAQDTYIPDSMKASTLLEQIGAERSWSSRDIEKDVDILERNRIYTVKELRVLSPESWKEIELLPLVKDLLRQAVNPPVDYAKMKSDKKKMKKEKKERKKQEMSRKMEKLSVKDDKKEKKDKEAVEGEVQTEQTTTTEDGLVMIHKDKKDKSKKKDKERKVDGDDEEACSSSSSSSSSSSTTSSDTDSEEISTPTMPAAQLPFLKTPGNSALLPGPGRIQPMGNRIRVTAGNGQTYEVDRYCPHKHVDLATKGVVVGNTLFCNKHNWAFALDNKGYCSKHSATINACKVDW